ncbi:MAG TPA: SDR family NAD(P)-dependent oxidoreductase [Haliangiales bacterium]|nr:SDR family NAD(P)-dependent oxidoreductase [Haliangiales bacterium]
MELTGKRVLITGASSGIGASLARELKDQGAKLILAARRVDELQKLADELGSATAEVRPADLGTPAGADELARAAGPVDVLVNNAGVDLVGKPWKDGLADRGDRLFQVNVLAAFRLTNRLLGAMVEKREGAVAFVSSVSAWLPFPGAAWYAASKAALHQFAQTIRIDVKGTGVRVLGVYPGPIHTPMLDKALQTEAGKKFFGRLPIGKVEPLARRIVDALLRDEETVVYPRVYQATSWLGGLSRRLVTMTTPPVKPR